MGNNTISKELKKVLEESNVDYFAFSKVDAETFYNALKEAKAHLEYSACVHLHTVE